MGPIDSETLQAYLESGDLTGEDLIFYEGLETWVQIDAVREELDLEGEKSGKEPAESISPPQQEATSSSGKDNHFFSTFLSKLKENWDKFNAALWSRWGIGEKIIFVSSVAAVFSMLMEWESVMGLSSSNGITKFTFLFLLLYVYPCWAICRLKPFEKLPAIISASLSLLAVILFIFTRKQQMHIGGPSLNTAGSGASLFLLSTIGLIVGIIKCPGEFKYSTSDMKGAITGLAKNKIALAGAAVFVVLVAVTGFFIFKKDTPQMASNGATPESGTPSEDGKKTPGTRSPLTDRNTAMQKVLEEKQKKQKEQEAKKKRFILLNTPLLSAIDLQKTEVIQAYIEAGKDLSSPDPMTGATPLHYACSAFVGWDKVTKSGKESKLEIIKLLLKNGVNVNAKDKLMGATPLYWAVSGDNNEIVKLLIANGANINATTTIGDTPLDHAYTCNEVFDEKYGAIRDRSAEMIGSASVEFLEGKGARRGWEIEYSNRVNK